MKMLSRIRKKERMKLERESGTGVENVLFVKEDILSQGRRTTKSGHLTGLSAVHSSRKCRQRTEPYS